MTIRNVPDEVHRAIRARAAKHGRSIESEMRNILEAAVRPQNRLRLGSMLAEAGRRAGLTEEDFTTLEHARDGSPARAAKFE
jgi:plasmid stability protein